MPQSLSRATIRRSKKWKAQYNDAKRGIGYYDDEEKAARAPNYSTLRL